MAVKKLRGSEKFFNYSESKSSRPKGCFHTDNNYYYYNTFYDDDNKNAYYDLINYKKNDGVIKGRVICVSYYIKASPVSNSAYGVKSNGGRFGSFNIMNYPWIAGEKGLFVIAIAMFWNSIVAVFMFDVFTKLSRGEKDC